MDRWQHQYAVLATEIIATAQDWLLVVTTEYFTLLLVEPTFFWLTHYSIMSTFQ